MRPQHLADHHRHRDLRNDSTLHVVTCVSNPARFESRYRLARIFMEEMSRTSNIKLYVAEAAYGDRHHEVTDDWVPAGPGRVDHHPWHLRVRTDSEIWIKENLINLAVARLLPRDWKYVAWVDADVAFRDPDWAMETLHELQHFHIVQPWRHALDLGSRGEVLTTFESFGHRWQEGGRPPKGSNLDYYSKLGHPGYAWACTRSFWEATGGLIDHGILGSGDRHMAYGCVGLAGKSLHQKLSPGYKRRVLDWERRARRITNGQVGYVPGRIEHSWHGKKSARGYSSRWNIILEHGFDPERHLTYDHQGLIQLVGKPDLEHSILRYNRSRDEDGA